MPLPLIRPKVHSIYLLRTFPAPLSKQCAWSTRQQLRRYSTDITSWQADLRESLKARCLPLIFDDLVPGPSDRLNVSLSSYLPPDYERSTRAAAQSGRVTSPPKLLPPSHHLVYFNPVLPRSVLLPDGTDPAHSPGPPFVRRMWAGGALRFKPGVSPARLNGGRWVCLEGIRDVRVEGKEREEKVYVDVERRFASLGDCGSNGGGVDEEAIRQRLWSDREDDWANSAFMERRTLVFMREGVLAASAAGADAGRDASRIVRARNPAEFETTVTPDALLLFRYSALTFNAHAIHLDPSYCRNIEGYRSLLVHGPLSLTLLVTVLQHHLTTYSDQPVAQGHHRRKYPTALPATSAKGIAGSPPEGNGAARIRSVEYRNLAPLYADEPIRLCGRRAGADGKIELWAERPNGGMAVRGIAEVTTGALVYAELQRPRASRHGT